MSETLDFDICIIGSGVAGGLLAAELAPTGKRIAVLEAGSRLDRSEQQRRLSEGGAEPYYMKNADHLHVPVSVAANFAWAFQQSKKVGGNSLYWGSWAVRPMPSHFQLKSRYGVGQDWPLGYEELEPYYCRAEEELGVSGKGEGPNEPPRSKPYPMPHFPLGHVGKHFSQACASLGYGSHPIPVARISQSYRGRVVCCLAAQCWTCPTTAKYSSDFTHIRAALASPNVKLLEETVASRLVTDSRGRVVSVVCHKPDRTQVTLKAGVFVLACNAIEGARLLLQSSDGGVANSSGMVGRNLMVHPSTDVSAISANPLFVARTWPTVYSRHFEDGPHRRSHAGFRLAPAPGDMPVMHARHFIEKGLFGKEFVASFAKSLSSAFRLMVEIEMLPDANNRLELDPAHADAFGNPGLKVSLNLGDYERDCWKAARAAIDGLCREMQAMPLNPEPFWSGGGHQMGTMRMGTDPKSSVVDTHLRSHDLQNLYVASAATYPSSLGPTNPTLTLAALTLRLADHLRKKVLT